MGQVDKAVDKKAAILSKKRGMSYRQIAQLQGVSPQAIHQAIHKDIQAYIAAGHIIKSFKDNRADILAGLQVRTLQALDEERLQKASVNNLAYAMAQFNSMERLERGLSTANASIQVGLSNTLQTSIDALVKRIPDTIEVSECAIVAQQDTQAVSTAK